MKSNGLKPAATAAAPEKAKRERGMALLVSVFVLMLVGLVAISAMQNSEDESTAGGRTRAAVNALYQADAGIEIALAHIRQVPPNPAPIDFDFGDGKRVQSKTRSDDTPKELEFAGTGTAPDGMALPSGASGSGYYNALYQVNITALDGNRATAEVEARLGSFAAR